MAYNPSNPNGQATMANSAPVVIASNQSAVPISDNSGSITVDGSVTVSGTVTSNAGTGTMNVSVQNASIPVTDNGGSLTIDGSVTVTQATAANLNANVTVQNASIPVTDNGGSLTVDNGGTFAVQAAQSGTWNITNVSGTVSLPTGAATSANQSTEITSLQLLDDVVATDGSAALTKLYQVGGTDGTNAQILSTNVSGHLNIADGGNSITVDGTVAATQSGTWSTRTQDGSGNSVTSRATGSARPFDVAIVDGSGNQVTSFGGGTQYADGTTVATPTGTASLGFDGTNVQVLSTNATGHLNIADGGNSITVDGTVAATQSGSWNVGLNAGSNAIGSITNTSFAATQATAANLNATVVGTGTFAVQAAQSGNYTVRNQDGAGNNLASSTTTPAGTEQALIVRNIPSGTQAVSGTVTANAGTGTFAVGDGGGSLTVDGTVAATQSGTWTLGANSGVDIGDVTINNTQAQQVFVQMTDGTNSIPVDTLHNDGESNTENHIDVAAKGMHYNGTTWDRVRGDTTGTNQQGNVAHDAVDSGNPTKLGAKAIAHGTNPTAVAAADRTDLYANRAGVLFTIGGHPNIITRTVYISDATGAQTDASMVGTIAAGTKVAVTQISVTVDSATTATGGVAVKVGFGATSIPADSSTGANGILLDHKGIAAGSGMVIGSGAGLIGIGADGEELRLTCEDPTGGGLSVMFSYYTIES